MRAPRRRSNQKNGRKQDSEMALKAGASRKRDGAGGLKVAERSSRVD